MQKRLLFLSICLIVFAGCQEKKASLPTHAELIGAQFTYVGEIEEPQAKKMLDWAENKKVHIEYKEEYLIATTWKIMNACGRPKANIATSNDSIWLLTKETAEELCSSVEIKRITYFIKNQENKSRVILR